MNLLKTPPPGKFTTPANKLTALSTLESVRLYQRLIHENSATEKAREQEITNLSDSDVMEAALNSGDSSKVDALIRLEAQRKFAREVVKNAKARLAELAPGLLDIIRPVQDRTARIHGENLRRIREHITRQLEPVGIPSEQLPPIVSRARLVREECYFQSQHPAAPIHFDLVRGLNADGVMCDLVPDPDAGQLIAAHDQSLANLKTAETRAKAIDSIVG
jgi:hypothetical protein